jgi:flagellar biosynthesis/type III secretory pathway protein FliH
MISSKPKAAYVANGAELEFPFEDNALLAKRDEQPFEDPPWRVLDTDVPFEPMAIKQTGDQVAGSEEAIANSGDSSGDPAEATAELDDGSSEADASNEAAADDDGTDWAEVGVPEPVVVGIPEEEVEARIAAAVAEAQASLHADFASQREALEAERDAAKAEVDTVRDQIAAELDTKYTALLNDSRQTYDTLTEKLAHASDNVSEFFEPLSKLSMHIAMQLVRGELNVGPTAIARLVQGCLDALEGYQPKNPPVLQMHPEDLATYLASIDGTPEGIQLRADDAMARGDVSLKMDDTAVDDLIAHRIEKMANRIFGLGHDFNDKVFRSNFEGGSDTEAAFEDIENFIESEVRQPQTASSSFATDDSAEATVLEPMGDSEDSVESDVPEVMQSTEAEVDAEVDALAEPAPQIEETEVESPSESLDVVAADEDADQVSDVTPEPDSTPEQDAR